MNPRNAPAPPEPRRLHAGRTYEQRRAERRQALLDTALELFGTRGYRSVTIEEICRVSHVTTRYFYEEFASRDDLLLALYDDLMASMIPTTRVVDADHGDVPASPRDRVAAVVHRLLDDPRVARIVYLETIGVSDALERRRREWHRGFADLFAAKAQLFDPAAPAAQARLRGLGAIGIIDEVIVDHLLGDQGLGVDVLIDSIHDMLEALGIDFLLSERPEGYQGSPDAPVVSPRPTRRR